jgi:hypothetical protein
MSTNISEEYVGAIFSVDSINLLISNYLLLLMNTADGHKLLFFPYLELIFS